MRVHSIANAMANGTAQTHIPAFTFTAAPGVGAAGFVDAVGNLPCFSQISTTGCEAAGQITYKSAKINTEWWLGLNREYLLFDKMEWSMLRG